MTPVSGEEGGEGEEEGEEGRGGGGGMGRKKGRKGGWEQPHKHITHIQTQTCTHTHTHTDIHMCTHVLACTHTKLSSAHQSPVLPSASTAGQQGTEKSRWSWRVCV